MILSALLVFGLILVAGRVSPFGRLLVSGLACLAGAILVAGAAVHGDAFSALIAGTGLMSTGSAGLLGDMVAARYKIALLVAFGLPWILALWMGARLVMAGSAPAAADGVLLISAGVLVLYVALIVEEATRTRPEAPARKRSTRPEA